MSEARAPRLRRLFGAVRHYAWGGDAFIADLLGAPQLEGPTAEYWLGAHPAAPSRLDRADGPALDEVLAHAPNGSWPFLYKVLDVARPLSIQVHPDAVQARRGFAAEEAAGIPVDAPHRNFRDPNAKPELAVALEPFWLLFGLAPEALIAKRLARHPSLAPLAALHGERGGAAVFEAVLRADEQSLARWIGPLLESVRGAAGEDPETPAFWLHAWLGDAPVEERIDRGVLGFLLMNILRLEPGEGIYQGPGVPHAYLGGRIVELMTSSDNVLRCGLTGKHVDPRAVLSHVDLDAREPSLVQPRPSAQAGRDDYPCPVDDFLLSRCRPAAGSRITLASAGPTVLLVLAGEARLETACGGEAIALVRGEAAMATVGTDCVLTAPVAAEVYVATVPVSAP